MEENYEHSFNIHIAKKYGIPEAIMLKHIYFWVSKNRANGKGYYDKKFWTYNSIKAFEELFVYWTYNQIRRTLESLIANKLIEKGNYNKNAYDRTSWYTITEKGENYFKLPICEKTQMELRNNNNRTVKNNEPIPDINKDIIKKINKKRYGEFKNVLLTDEELNKLKNEFNDYKERIENLSCYIESSGKKYKSHYATILNWSRKEIKTKGGGNFEYL